MNIKNSALEIRIVLLYVLHSLAEEVLRRFIYMHSMSLHISNITYTTENACYFAAVNKARVLEDSIQYIKGCL